MPNSRLSNNYNIQTMEYCSNSSHYRILNATRLFRYVKWGKNILSNTTYRINMCVYACVYVYIKQDYTQGISGSYCQIG